MELTEKLLTDLQNRLKIGNRKGVHLNAIPANSRYKFDLTRLKFIDKNLPGDFIDALLTQQPLKYRISWKDNVLDLNSLLEEDQTQLIKITKAFENLINQTEAIESEKGINTFGFGFPILVRRDQLDNKLTVAPILIWSLRIKRTKEFNTWEILRNEEDPIYLNEVLLNHLQNDSNIQLEQIPSEMLDDGLICKEELIDICFNIIKSINSSVPGDLRENFQSKIKNISSIGDKSYYEKQLLNTSNAFIDFGGLFSIFEVQKQNIIHDYDALLNIEDVALNLKDMVEHSFQPISSVETDPSQQSILHSLEETRNVLIQGPPGTGKSQTLTAVLINALENHKKTIVVCEKRTALEVLHNALIDKGLGQHCVLIRDIVKDRKAVVDSVRDRVDDSSYRSYSYTYSKETLDSIISKAKGLIESINTKHKKLDEKLLGNKNWSDIVGTLLKELKEVNEDYNLNLDKNYFVYSAQEFSSLVDLMNEGQLLYDNYKSLEGYSFINSQKFIGDNPFLLELKINEDFDHYRNEIEKIKKLESEFRDEYSKTRFEKLNANIFKAKRLIASIESLYEAHKGNPDFNDVKKTNGFIYKLLAYISKEKKKVLEDQAQLRSIHSNLENELHAYKDILKDDFFKSNIIPNNLLDEKLLILESLPELFLKKTESEFDILNLLSFKDTQYNSDTLIELQKEVKELLKRIDTDSWTLKKLENRDLRSFIADVAKLIQERENYFSNEKDLFTIEFQWFKFYNQLSDKNKILINKLKTKSTWAKVFSVYYLNSMLINSASTDLPTEDKEHLTLNAALGSIEKEQLTYIGDYWFAKQVDACCEFEHRNKNLSVENLYNKRSSHRFKRLSLRQIVQYDTDLFTTFFPIILTSPDVCSNLFKGVNGYFDIVMFDEASQLRLEDNLPALLKGKQIIIAGDEHQMPPANYFSKVFDGSVEDEEDLEEEEKFAVDKDNLLLSCESLLEFASEMNFQKKHLDFHYRSKHPYLIDFSNFAFYNQRLKPLPNSFEYNPIKYIQVNGTFSDHVNETEAEMVLSIIENNIERLPNGEYPSVGVATFNIAQRNLIKSKILERQKFSKYEKFNAKIQELEEKGMFIKNLENIQGDEKDVIILSTTYGIGKDGKFAQRFGPINHSKGYKLLNVIVTRAKYKVYVCSSIPEQVFMNFKEHLIVEGANNKRAVFYAYLAYSKAISEGNDVGRQSVLSALSDNSEKNMSIDSFRGELESPFEEEVYHELVKNFGEKNLIPQLQFAGFRIDIVYDSHIPGVPKIAIECDGAKYHSSREAYLYDRHRQKILESHGFVFHRIWSTNWWRSSKRETARLVDFIRNIEGSRNSILTDFTKTALAFTDHIQNIAHVEDDTYKPLMESIDVPNITSTAYKPTLESIEVPSDVLLKSIDIPTVKKAKVSKSEAKLIREEIKLNSKVKVKYLNNNKEMNVQLVDVDKNKINGAGGLQKIYIKSPLAEAIIGYGVGDILKVGKLDNYVQILEVVN